MPDEAEEWKVRYEGLAHNDDLDLDWRKDEGMVTEKRWGGAVTFVDGIVDGYSAHGLSKLELFFHGPPQLFPLALKDDLLLLRLLLQRLHLALRLVARLVPGVQRQGPREF